MCLHRYIIGCFYDTRHFLIFPADIFIAYLFLFEVFQLFLRFASLSCFEKEVWAQLSADKQYRVFL